MAIYREGERAERRKLDLREAAAKLGVSELPQQWDEAILEHLSRIPQTVVPGERQITLRSAKELTGPGWKGSV
jgi:hypothetical protein